MSKGAQDKDREHRLKELLIREKVNWVDGCKEYLVTLPYSYRYSPCSYILYYFEFYSDIKNDFRGFNNLSYTIHLR